jgi:tetratricopeptide (TPR) repeat protein
MKRILFASVGVLSMAAAALAQDVVRLRSGSEMKGKVTGLTAKNVIIVEAGNKSTALKAEDVASITLGEPPPSLLKADQAIAGGDINNRTMTLFDAALKEIGEKKAREFHKQYVFLSWAEALQKKASTQEALDMLKRLRTECGGDCFLRAESWRRSKEIARGKGQELYESVLKEMKDEPEPVASEAELEMARIKYDRGDYEAALALFDHIAAAGGPMARDAMLWQLRCLRQLKKEGPLESLCGKILGDRQNNSASLLQSAGATVAALQLPKVGKDKGKVRDVLMNCLQAIAMGPPQGKEEGEDYALALITGADCYIILSRDLEKPEAKEDYRNRAIGYLREVKSHYRGKMGDEAAKKIIAIEGDKPKEVPK